MLIDFRRSALRIIQDASAFHHRLGQMMGLRWGHSLEENRHRPRAYLKIGDLTVRKSGDELANFVVREFLTFAFLFNESRNVHFRHTSWARDLARRAKEV